MKRYHILFVLILTLSACLPTQATLVPVDTLVALTMESMAETGTPTLPPTLTPSNTPTLEPYTPTPEINFAAAGAFCVPTNTERVRALVTRILDGDSIEVSSAFETFRVRYIGAQAPGIAPTVEWQGPQAIAANDRLVGGKYVTLVSDVANNSADGYYLRYVLVDDIFANYDIIRQGFAQAVSEPPNVACDNAFAAAQLEAQTGLRGIWLSTPVPTFTFTPIPTNTITPTITLTPTRTRIPPCTCRPMTCNFFSTQKHAQSCYEYCLDTGYGQVLEDKNNNGKVCESLP